MHWLTTILLGLLIGFGAAVYGGFVATLAVPWLRISSFEGNSGYFVAFMILLAFVLGSIGGMILCGLTGGPGLAGAMRGFGIGLGGVCGAITILGGFAWASADREPLLDGKPLDVAIELRLPPGSPPPVAAPDGEDYVVLYSGPKPRTHTGPLDVAAARLEDGRWILPGSVAIRVSEGNRLLGVKLKDADTLFFGTGVPARPTTGDMAWSDWRRPNPEAGAASSPREGIELRYRVVLRPPPPPPPEPEPLPAAAPIPEPDAATEAWLAFTGVNTPPEIRARAVAAVRDRPDFVPLLAARIAAEDPDTARDAMYLVGEMRPPPAALGDAVRQRAARIVAIAEAIDPAAPDSRDVLWQRAHTVATGVFAASFGLRSAGVDMRPELRAMSAAAAPREKDLREIAATAERIIAYFDRLDREGRVLD